MKTGSRPDLAVAIRVLIADRRAALAQLEAAMDVYDRAFGERADPAVSRNGHGAAMERLGRTVRRNGRLVKRRKPLAPGSLGDRLVEIVTEANAPVKRAHLDEHAGAKPYHVGLTLKELVADQRLVRLGATSTRRYATPAMARKDS